MASLNLSTNGPSIKSSYNGVVSGPPPSSSSPTYAQWALFSVQTPLVSAFQHSAAKESVLKVQSTGDGELADLMQDFNEGRIQFAFVKVKDPNTALPKCVLIAWCGGGVPERTKGYFTSHTAAVAKVLHGYHVQITARSDGDLEPESIMTKVSDASGSRYSAGSSSGVTASASPPKSKPVFTPTASSGLSVSPLVAARSRSDENLDEDGWGADAPPVTRTEIEKVESAYRPTKVNMAELTKQKAEPSRFAARSQDDGPSDVIGGGYQPVGRVDIAAIRAAARNQADERPTPVKGAYEPVGKVDIAAIRAKAQKPAQGSEDNARAPNSVADSPVPFAPSTQSERITTLPKPKVANRLGGTSNFTGTNAPTPGGIGFGVPNAPAPAPVGSTSRTFADQGGKTPAQIWAEKKGKGRSSHVGDAVTSAGTTPVSAQKSGGGEWKSGYTGKTWAPVQAPGYGRGASESVSQQNTGDDDRSAEAEPVSSAVGVSSLRGRFKDEHSIGSAVPAPLPKVFHNEAASEPAAPPVPANSRPSGGFAIPGLPNRPLPPADDEEEEDQEEEQENGQGVTDRRGPSPIRVAAPVLRGAGTDLGRIGDHHTDESEQERLADENEAAHMARGGAGSLTEQTFEPGHQVEHEAEQGSRHAVIQYDYDKAEDNEIDLVEGEYITNIDMVDEDWWMGTNSKSESGLFPSNYVELVDGDHHQGTSAPVAAGSAPASRLAAVAEPEPEPSHAADASPTATALYDYEAAEDNELTFPEDAKITNLEFPDEDWWFGHYNGQSGLFPANYVQLDS